LNPGTRKRATRRGLISYLAVEAARGGRVWYRGRKENYHLLADQGAASIGAGCDIQHSHLGRNTVVQRDSAIRGSVLGDYTVIGRGNVIRDSTLGAFCASGADVWIGLGEHPLSGHVSWHPAMHSHRPEFGWDLVHGETYPVTPGSIVGNEVGIGARAMIMGGVRIGDGAVVLPGTVVTKDVQPYAVVAGSPARLVRYRFDEPTRRRLLEIAWWTWPEERLRAMAHLFDDVDAFLAALDAESRDESLVATAQSGA